MKPGCVAASALAALLAGCGDRDRDAVATVNGAPITRTEAAIELRHLLWRRGETWSALAKEEQEARREAALQNLMNRRLLAGFAARHPTGGPAVVRETGADFECFLRQFAPPDEWRKRMKMQGLDEPALRASLAEETRSIDSVENWLAQQPGKITGTEARTWHEAHRENLIIPERVRASHIFLTRHDREKPDRGPEIREIHRKLVAGEATFEDLAAKNSDDESAKLRAGDLGWFARGRVPDEFADRVFALPVGETSAPFESRLGWHILIVREKHPARAATFEEAKDEVMAMLDREWREASIRRLLEDLRSKATLQRFGDRTSTISPE